MFPTEIHDLGPMLLLEPPKSCSVWNMTVVPLLLFSLHFSFQLLPFNFMIPEFFRKILFCVRAVPAVANRFVRSKKSGLPFSFFVRSTPFVRTAPRTATLSPKMCF
jgi:hypothetical protein